MKKSILLLAAFCLLVVGSAILGDCNYVQIVQNLNQPAITGFNGADGTWPANVEVKYWTLGKYVATTGGGVVMSNCCSSAIHPTLGTCIGVVNGCDMGTMLTNPDLWAYNGDAIFHDSLNNWGVGGPGDIMVYMSIQAPGSDGCPHVLTDRLIFYADESLGKFGLLSQTGNFGTQSLDDIPVQTAVAIPTPTTVTSASQAAGTWTVTFDWTALTQGQARGGFAAGDDPGVELITGYKVYYQNVAGAGSPSGLHILNDGWVICGGSSTVAGYGSNSTTITFPDPGKAVNSSYIALSLTLADGLESNFTGQPLQIVAPTGAGVFANASATASGGQIQAFWSSAVETGVASYQAHFSYKIDGAYRPVGDVLQPTGDGSFYQTTWRAPVMQTSQTLYVKIRANLLTGGEEWSDVIKVNMGVQKAPRADM